MNAQSTQIRMLLSLSLLMAIVAVSREAAFADEAHHEGTFVGIRGSRIAILNRDHTQTRVFPMTGFVRVTRNGMDAGLGDLQRGDAVQIFTETRFRAEYVTSIAAVSD